ncbi:YcaO-like family protein [Paenibacillus sp. RS8]|uniref:YcaO-like family protein n=1 Tax=Paenibacillus sp. RS8 TaxID=3242681 RepID=UPI0035C1F13E
MSYPPRYHLLVNERTGIVNNIQEVPILSASIPLYTFVASRKPLKERNLDLLSDSFLSGVGTSFFNKDEARISALGEAIERYSSLFTHPHRLIERSYNQLSGEKIDPTKVTRYTPDYYNIEGFPFVDVSLDSKLMWVEGISLTTRKKIWIPADLVFFPDIVYPNLIRENITTGLAAGSSLEMAEISGCLECIERDAITLMWLNKTSKPIIDLETIMDADILEIVRLVKETGFSLFVLDITTDINVPSFFCLIINDLKVTPYISCGAKTDFNKKKALIGAIKEASQCFNYMNTPDYKIRVASGEFNEINSMDSHILYYAYNMDNFHELDFLLKGEYVDFNKKNCNRFEDMSELLEYFSSMHYDLVAFDLTTSDVNKGGMNVVRVIAPQLAHLECRYPALNCERLDRNNEYNKAPHPFA